MFHILQTKHSRANDMIEEFGYNDDISKLGTPAELPGIGATSQTVMFQPLCGLFQQTKYLPLRYAPLEIELDLCTLDNALENSYVSHFRGGKTIKIVYNTFTSTLQTVVAAETQINVSRSLSKMKVFL